jgi:hypothetical protein
MDVLGFEERGEDRGEGPTSRSSRIKARFERSSLARLSPHPSPLPGGERGKSGPGQSRREAS